MILRRSFPLILIVMLIATSLVYAADLALDFTIDDLNTLKSGRVFESVSITGADSKFPERTQIRITVNANYPLLAGDASNMFKSSMLHSANFQGMSSDFKFSTKVSNGNNEGGAPGFFTVKLQFDARQARQVKALLGDNFKDIIAEKTIWVGGFDHAFEMFQTEFKECQTAPGLMTNANTAFIKKYIAFKKIFKPMDPNNPPNQEQQREMMQQLMGFQKEVMELQKPLVTLTQAIQAKRKSGMMKEGFSGLSSAFARMTSQIMSVSSALRGGGSIPPPEEMDASLFIQQAKVEIIRATLLTMGFLCDAGLQELPARFESADGTTKQTMTSEWSKALMAMDGVWKDFNSSYSSGKTKSIKAEIKKSFSNAQSDALKTSMTKFLDGLHKSGGPVENCETLIDALKEVQSLCADGNTAKAKTAADKAADIFTALHKQLYTAR